MKKATPGKVIITPRPPAGSQEGDGADILLKCDMPRLEDLRPIDPADAKKQEPVRKDEKLPKIKAPDLKDKAKPCCPKPELKKK